MVVLELALERHKAGALEDDVALRVGQDVLLDPVAAVGVGVGQVVERDARVLDS